ncbi:MAG TPA: glycosyltransferase family 4 protein [Bryobacteraceae bacterium]|nr:glycosyltransferase family 4 protein [Bryobacteraceae bacterium]
MRILMAHNFYRQPGGEDQVFAAESRVLEEQGHTVIRMVRDYSQLEQMGRTAVARASVWNGSVYRELRQTIRNEHIQLAHFHNTFPLISPSAYYAARAEGVPVIQSLHNYRLLCPGALFYREGRVCEDCLGRAVPWPGVLHSCYRGSTLQTGALAGMLGVHRLARTWSGAVDIYIALTEFARNKFVAGGLPNRKILVKPNFMNFDPGPGSGDGGFALFVGRLTQDKGIQVLIDAWRQVNPAIPLKLAGEGPMFHSLCEQVRGISNIDVLGARSREEVLSLMKAANVLVVPSQWYEGFPMTIVEAYACGLPVIASDLGSLSSVVSHGVNGILFRPGAAGALAAGVNRLFANQEELRFMRDKARATFEHSYSPERGYSALMSVYEAARQQHDIKTQRELVHG